MFFGLVFAINLQASKIEIMILIFLLVIVIGVIVIFFFNSNDSCQRFKSEKEIAECLNLTDEQFKRIKEMDGNFVNYYGDTWLEQLYERSGKSGNYNGFKNYLIDRAHKIGKRYSDKGSMILGISGLVVLLVVWIFGIYTEVDYNPETETHFLCGYKYVTIEYADWHLCKLYSFVCSIVSWISYIGFGAYFISYISSRDEGELTEQIGYVIAITMMLVGFSIHSIFLRYRLFSSDDLFFFQHSIGNYFGLYNLWCALIALVLITVVFVSHRFEIKRRYMDNVSKRIVEFYEKRSQD